MEKEIQQLRSEIEQLKNRNLRVEQDKAWETSNLRKALVAILTYFTILSFFILTGTSNPFLNAIVPTIGFLLSTITIRSVKAFWIKRK